MKKIFVIIFISVVSLTFAQNDCMQVDDTYSYAVSLNIDNVSPDFDKDDFINYVVSNDNISVEDEETLNTLITSVKKTVPPWEHNHYVSITSTESILSIITEITNSVGSYHCFITECEGDEGPFTYSAVISDYPEDGFDKDDLINLLSINDNISDDMISMLNQEIISVIKPFEFSSFIHLHLVIDIESNIKLFDILNEFTNTIEFHQCYYTCENEEDCLLGEDNLGIEGEELKKIMIYPNPTSNLLHIETSQIDITAIGIFDLQGKRVMQLNSAYLNGIDVSQLTNGIYFIKVSTSEGELVKKFVKK
ncbi:T9SS type A sorting domain-containing protein [Psychroflexus salis]|uniref:Secretion system C-terminal sorting domain-containing protein n=1 Tax=Psychroflexus salis TaxID=1526574 RepID=A0A917E6H1_9FLAO|nr:T9SS type A sorting domain-containing protein [Psychroflexus salis]GGE04198.1 hypothetical protein GCM10010831_02250 [Psychroflexus salis]